MHQDTMLYTDQEMALLELAEAYRQAINSCGPIAVNKFLSQQMKELDQSKVQFKVH